MREIEAIIERKELQNKIKLFTQAGLKRRALVLKQQLAEMGLSGEATDRRCVGNSNETDSFVHRTEKGEVSLRDGASEQQAILSVNQVALLKAHAPSFESWQIDNLLSRAYKWFISIPSADRMRKRFRNPLLEKLLLLGEVLAIDGKVLERIGHQLIEHPEGLEWRDWYWLLYRRVEEKVMNDIELE